MLDIVTRTIIQASAVSVAVTTLLGTLFSFFRWVENNKKQDKEISRIKEENKIVCEAISACLDGLSQLGANHVVTTAKAKLDAHLLEQAHK